MSELTCVKNDSVEEIEKLRNDDAIVEAIYEYNFPRFKIIFENGDYDANGYLVTKFYRNRVPLNFVICSEGNKEMLLFLLDKGLDVNKKYMNSEETALMISAGEWRRDIVRILLDNGANIHDQDIRSQTALSYAIKGKRFLIVKLLMDHGAIPSELDLDFAYRREGNDKIIYLLESYMIK